MSPQQRREAVRTAILQWLAERLSLSFELDVIVARVSKSGLVDFELEKIESLDGLNFLKGSGFVTAKPHAHGATLFYQVTSAGVLAHENGTLQPRPL